MVILTGSMAHPLCSLLLALGGVGHDLGQQVSHDLAPDQDISIWLPSADGRSVFYTVAEPGFVGAQFFRASTDGSQDAVEISDPLVITNLYRVYLSRDESRIVFSGDLDTDDQIELYSLATDGSKTIVKLSPALTPSDDVAPYNYQLTPDGTRVVFRIGLSFGRLYCAPIDGSAPAVLLNPSVSATVFQVAGSQRVVFQWGDVYSVPLDGSAAPVMISATTGVTHVWHFYVSPDGLSVAFMGVTYPSEPDPEFSNPRYWIFGVPTDGSAAPELLFAPVRPIHFGGNPDPKIAFSPDSRRVVQRTDSYPEPNELFSAPVDGSSPSVRLSALPDGGGVGSDFRFAADGRVVFGYSANGVPPGIYVAQADGSVPAQRLTSLSDYPHPVKWEVGGGHVVFVAYAPDPVTSELRYEPYSVPLDGSTPSVKLSPRMVPGGNIAAGNVGNAPSFRISADGEWVGYAADQEVDGVDELYVVPADGRMRARKIHRTLPAGVDLSPFSFAFLAGSKRALYSGQQDELGTYELFTTELGDPLPFLGGSSSVPGARPIR